MLALQRNRPQASYNLMEQSEGVFHNASTGVKAMDQLRFVIDDEDKRIDFKQIPFIAKIIEKYRWPTTMVLQSKYYLKRNVYMAWMDNLANSPKLFCSYF